MVWSGPTRYLVTGDNCGAGGAIAQVDLNYLPAVRTLQLNDTRGGGHLIKDAPITIWAPLNDFDFIGTSSLHSVRSSSSMSIRTSA